MEQITDLFSDIEEDAREASNAETAQEFRRRLESILDAASQLQSLIPQFAEQNGG